MSSQKVQFNRAIRSLVAVGLPMVAGWTAILIAFFGTSDADAAALYATCNQISTIMREAEAKHYASADPLVKDRLFNRHVMIENARRGFLEALDPDRLYLTSKAAQDLMSIAPAELSSAVFDRGDCSAFEKAYSAFEQGVNETYRFLPERLEDANELNLRSRIIKAAQSMGARTADSSVSVERPTTERSRVANVIKKLTQLYVAATRDEEARRTPETTGYALARKRFNQTRKRSAGIKSEQLPAIMLQSMLERLDPHADYFGRIEAMRFRRMLQGQPTVGIFYKLTLFGATVTGFDASAPAEIRRDVQRGDLITAINGRSTYDMTAQEMDEQLISFPNQKTELTITRNQHPLTVQYTRPASDAAAVESRPSAEKSKPFEIRNRTGYLRLSYFVKSEMESFLTSLESMREQIGSLVIDLRGNPGGLTDGAAVILSHFLPSGAPLYYSANSREREVEVAQDTHWKFNGPIVVLVDEETASAAEIVAGVLKTYKRAVIVGSDRTFGKGSQQSVFNVNGGIGAVKITVRHHFLPNGRPFHGIGIDCDVKLAGGGHHGQFEENLSSFDGTPNPLRVTWNQTSQHEWMWPALVSSLQKKQRSRGAEQIAAAKAGRDWPKEAALNTAVDLQEFASIVEMAGR